MTDELKPCPFCGHEPKYIGANAQFAVACVNDACLCLANSDYVGAWNTRPVEDALRARVTDLEAQWASVPWEAIVMTCRDNISGDLPRGRYPVTVLEWVEEHAPHALPQEPEDD